MSKKLIYTLLLLTVVALMGVPQVSANPQILGNFTTLYDVAGTRIDVCATCHTIAPTLNPYGTDLQADASFNRNNPIQAMQNIEPDDSDTDTFTNIDEIHNLTFPGNVTDFPPKITSFSPATPVSDTGTPATRTFSVVVNQVVDTITWYLDGTVQTTDNFVSGSNFAATTSVAALHNVTAVAQRTGDGSAMQKWDWTVTNVTPPGNGTIAGKVTNASSTEAIAGATVTAGSVTAITNATGDYSISIAPDTYTVTASATGFQTGTASVTVSAGTVTTQDFALTPTPPPSENGTIAGKVTNASSTEAIAGATVTAGSMTAITNATGDYSISILAGTYNVTAKATGYEDKTVTGVMVTANTTTTQNFALTPKPPVVETGTIAGKVTNASSGSPISGATVKANNKTATTNADGNYSITIAQGTYTVTASAPGYEDKTVTGVTVTANTTTTQNFTLTPKPIVPPSENGSISGKVIDVATGMGIPNVEIKLVGIVGKDMDTRSIKMETTTDTTGMWMFDNLPAGRYIIIEKLPKGYIPITPPVMNIMLEQGENSMDNDFEVKPISALLPPMQAMES